MITEEQIEQAIAYLKKEEYVPYFDLMDEVIPIQFKEKYQELRDLFVEGTEPKIQALLLRFTKKMRKRKQNPLLIILVPIVVVGGILVKIFLPPKPVITTTISIRGYFVDEATSQRVKKQGTVFIKGQTSTKTLVNGEGGFTLKGVRWSKGAALEYVLELNGYESKRYPVYLKQEQLQDGVYEVGEVVIELPKKIVIEDTTENKPDTLRKTIVVVDTSVINPPPPPPPVKKYTITIKVGSKFYNGFGVKVNGQIPEIVEDSLFLKVIKVPSSINAKIEVYATKGSNTCSKTISINKDTVLEFINC